MLRVLAVAGVAIIVSAFSISAGVRQETVIVSGTATDCDGAGVHPIESLGIWVFDPSVDQEVVNVLNGVSQADLGSDSGVARFNADYEALLHLLTTPTALARDTTSSLGAFSVTIPARDSVLVLGFTDPEGDTYYLASQVIGARTNATVALDLSAGECFPGL